MMKRTVTGDLPPPKRSSLQQPVSCQLCRTRKLKCDRERPCSNCSSRNTTCVYAADPIQEAQPSPPPYVPVSTGMRLREGDHESFARRLRRLEDAVFGPDMRNTDVPHHFSRPSGSDNPKSRQNQDEEQQFASRWLEDMATTPAIASASNEDNSCSFWNGLGEAAEFKATSPLDISRVLDSLPTLTVAEDLLQRFLTKVNILYHMLHVQTAWSNLYEMYGDLSNGRTPTRTRLAFALSIFAVSAYLDQQGKELDSTSEPPRVLSEKWFRYAVFLLTTPPIRASTEALQALVAITHLSMEFSGFSTNFHGLWLSTIRMAQEMRIHRLDTPYDWEERKRNGVDPVDVESKRRLWWHIVSSDWLLASIGGPQEGTYLLHPRQIETNYPSNVDDDSITTSRTYSHSEDYGLPLTSPTTMTYFICRIKAATLSREVVDRLPPSYFSCPGADSSNEIYDTILLLDHNYSAFLKSLPPFFRLDSYQSDASVFREKPYLDPQRSFINFTIYTHITRLHRPFLIRGSSEPKFAYSRMQCIRSAEMVLDIRRNRMAGREDLTKLYYVQHHVLMAVIVLAMDVCFNSDELKIEERKADILAACQLLENSSSTGGTESEPDLGMSRGLQKAVRSLRDMLNKHKARHRAGDTGIGYLAVPKMDKSKMTDRLLGHRTDHGDEKSGFPPETSTNQHDQFQQQPFDELWSDFFSVAPSFDIPDWTELLADLDSQLGTAG
ncbi:transcriptional regulator family: Fungal Specific TF [Paecilomyces variotii]|nr:transcriptional regulator family: Fungal Specific TF [Paecilomyces variotii]KAJ9240753.1 transcriptional regulator family: Fungal Specific TF [Paecilomyces variotii]